MVKSMFEKRCRISKKITVEIFLGIKIAWILFVEKILFIALYFFENSTSLSIKLN